MRLPSLFVSHGSPMFALEGGATAPALAAWAANLAETPKAIVVMSPHWMTRGVSIQGSERPATWHDFGGFPAPLYELQYPAPSSLAVSDRIADFLAESGIPSRFDAARPFDHGAWVPLMHLFPQANIPVVQLSLPVDASPLAVAQIGAALAPLAHEGVLLMGSGSMTHNLSEFRGQPLHSPVAPYVSEFARWVEAQLQSGDTAALLDYRRLAPNALRAHPTDEHYLPLYFALGSAGFLGEMPRFAYLSREVMYGVLAMDAMEFSAS